MLMKSTYIIHLKLITERLNGNEWEKTSQKKKQINDLNNTQSEIQYKEHFYATENMVSL